VWGYPHYLTLFELQLQVPLLKYLTGRPDTGITFAPWVGPDAVNEAVTTVMEMSEHDILSVDFSGFDASIPRILIEEIFDIMLDWFVASAHPLIRYVGKAFLNIGLLTPEGILEDRNGGVPSGSGLTNLVDSLVQLFAFNYIAYRMNSDIDFHIVQGDDGVVSFNTPWSLDNVVNIARELNLKVSSDKGGVSRDRVYFLQNIHSKSWSRRGVYPGIRPIMRILNGALSYERFKNGWKPEDDTLRWIQQFENGKYHPRFPEAVSFLYGNDKYLRRYSIHELIERAGGPEKVESVLGIEGFSAGKLLPQQYGTSAVVAEVVRLKSEGVSPHQPRRR